MDKSMDVAHASGQQIHKRTKAAARVVVKAVYVGNQPMEEVIRTAVVDCCRRRERSEK